MDSRTCSSPVELGRLSCLNFHISCGSVVHFVFTFSEFYMLGGIILLLDQITLLFIYILRYSSEAVRARHSRGIYFTGIKNSRIQRFPSFFFFWRTSTVSCGFSGTNITSFELNMQSQFLLSFCFSVTDVLL